MGGKEYIPSSITTGPRVLVLQRDRTGGMKRENKFKIQNKERSIGAYRVL